MSVRPIPPSESEYLLDLLRNHRSTVSSTDCQGRRYRYGRDEDGNCQCPRCEELTKIEAAEEAVEAASEVVGREQGRAA